MTREQAFKKYERQCITDPKDGMAHFALALLYDANDDLVQASKYFQSALALFPKNPSIHFFNGCLLARYANKQDLAIGEWERACEYNGYASIEKLHQTPQDVEFPLFEKLTDTLRGFEREAKKAPGNEYLAVCYAFAIGVCFGPEKGLSTLEEFETSTTNSRALTLRGLLLFLAEHYEESVKILEMLRDQEKNSTQVLYLLANIYLKTNRTAQAIRSLERLKELEPRNVRALEALGEVYFRQRRFDLAAQTFEAILGIDPKNAKAHYLLGRGYQEMYRLEAALAEYKEALHLDSSLTEVHFHAGLALSRMGKWPEAIQSLQEALKLNPEDVTVEYNLGLAYNQVGNYQEAIRLFENAIMTNPKDAFLHYSLGLAYEKTNRLSSAVNAYQQAIQLNPNDSYARYHLALCHQRLGDYSLAMGELEEVLKQNPQDAYAAYNLGSVYAALGFAESALGAYSRASQLNPNDLYAHFNIGSILARDGMIEEANEEFKKVLELTPRNDGELALYSTLASQMAVNIEIANLNAKLKETYYETVKAIISCLAEKDNYTAGHTNRVSIISTEIGKAMKLSREDMESLAIAAVLHDIGKLGVPDAILLKQGKLTTEEFMVMKEHPVKGAKILENVRFPWVKVVACVKHHHERYDGSGYPEGLKGEEIPIGARILSLADFFDALATERPYKKAYPIPVVIEQAKLQVNKAFDPNVIAVLDEVAERLIPLYKPAEELTEVPSWESSLIDSA